MNERFTEVSDDDYIDPMFDDQSNREGCTEKAALLFAVFVLAGCGVYFLIELL